MLCCACCACSCASCCACCACCACCVWFCICCCICCCRIWSPSCARPARGATTPATSKLTPIDTRYLVMVPSQQRVRAGTKAIPTPGLAGEDRGQVEAMQVGGADEVRRLCQRAVLEAHHLDRMQPVNAVVDIREVPDQRRQTVGARAHPAHAARPADGERRHLEKGCQRLRAVKPGAVR